MSAELNPNLRRLASVALLGLIVLCVAWETVLAPIRPGGSLLFLKALPLLFPLRGVLRGNVYTYQWAAMLVLLYLMEGVVRAMSDPAPMSAALAGIEIALSSVFFIAAICYVRPSKRAARVRARNPASSMTPRS